MTSAFSRRLPYGGSSFQSGQSTEYSARLPGGSSFNSTSANGHTSQTGNTGFQPAMNNQLSRADSTYNHVSSVRDPVQSIRSLNGMERNNSRLGNGTQRSSNSSTPAVGGPVRVLTGSRDLSAEDRVSQSSTPESSITRKNKNKNNSRNKNKNKIIEDTSAVPTPLSRPRLSNTEFTSQSRLTQIRTPQLRSRRGQSIASVSDTVRNQTVSSWAVAVSHSSDSSVVNNEDMRRRGSPVNTLSNALTMSAITAADPFISSVNNSHPFDCMAAGPFIGNFAAKGPFSNDLLTLTSGGRRNPSLSDAIDPHNVPFAEYCRFAKPDNWGVIKIKNLSTRKPS